MVNMLIKASKAAGIKIHTNKPVILVEKENDGFLVRVQSKSETETQSFRAERVVHGADRIADIEDLQFEKAGVKTEKEAIVVDKHMRNSNPRIYAGGDCVLEGMQLTPVASLQGEVAATNILEGNSIEADYAGIPSAVFTIPVLASVGINAAKDSDKYKVIFQDRSNWNTTRRAGIEFAASKVIIDEANDRIMGAHILGPNAGRSYQYFRCGNAARAQSIGYQKVCIFISYYMFRYSFYML